MASEQPIAIVTLSQRRGAGFVDSEVPVRTLAELYDTCRRLAPEKLVRVLLRGPHGEVRLNFASYIEGGPR